MDKAKKFKVCLKDWYKPTKSGEKARRALGMKYAQDQPTIYKRTGDEPTPPPRPA